MTPEFKAWLRSGARRCLLAEVEVRAGGVNTVRYLSTTGYISGAADTPDSTAYLARLTGGFSFEQDLDVSGAGGGGASFGELLVDNIDGALDTWLFDVWSRRSVKLYLGDPTWSRSQFVLVFEGTVADIEPRSRGTLALVLRDALAVLDVPITTDTVGGTGANADSAYPVALGECFNVEPQLVSETGLATYRVNLGAVEQIVEVRDNGYPVTVIKNEAAGTFTLQYQRWGQITCDVQGAKPGSGYLNDVGGLVYALATEIGTGPRLLPAQFDTAALVAFRAACPQPVGLFADGRMTVLDAIRALSASVGATTMTTRLGQVRLVRLGFGTPTLSVTPDDMVGGSFEPVGRPQITGKVRLSGLVNWTPQAKNSLVADLQPNQITSLSERSTIKDAYDNTVLTDYNQVDARDEEVETLLVVESDLQAEATRRLNLWKVPRTVFRFTTYFDRLDIELGDTLTVTHPRLGLASGAPALVTRVETDFVSGRIGIEVLV